MTTDDSTSPTHLSRRDLLKVAGAAGAAALAPSGMVAAAPAPAAPTALPALPLARAAGPLLNLTAAETEILSAIVDRLIPSDDLGPGALEAGALRFIDRALSEAESATADAYRAGLAALDRYSSYSRGAPFVELSARDQDSVLIDVQTGAATGTATGFEGSSAAFFNLVKDHTWQAMFGDPQYGGNADFAGWDLIRYPGVRLRVSDEEQRMLEAEALEPARRSAYDFGQFQTRTQTQADGGR
ncbi:MAG: gluconate 2-dehydrogenase subunit 3 family protein [Gemmatimonadales bacterium]